MPTTAQGYGLQLTQRDEHALHVYALATCTECGTPTDSPVRLCDPCAAGLRAEEACPEDGPDPEPDGDPDDDWDDGDDAWWDDEDEEDEDWDEEDAEDAEAR